MITSVFAKDLGQTGIVYRIEEPDLLQVIQQKLQALQNSGKLLELQQAMNTNILQTVNTLAPVLGLKTVGQPKRWYLDPSIRLSRDISAPNGKLIAKKGQLVNPLDTMPLNKALLFFDARSERQQRWAWQRYAGLQQQAMLILTGGRVLDLMKQWKVPVYFDQDGKITTRLHITAVPALVTAQGSLLVVSEEVAP